MQYEVEQKFPVSDLMEIQGRLLEMGASFDEPIEQVDRYFAHPGRDFASTDEALRIRQVGTRCRVTYKGPKVDTATKTRQEIELPLGNGPHIAPQWTSLLEALGFTPVLDVRKRRRCGRVAWNGATVEIALDELDRIGTFVELELAVDADEVQTAKSQILSLADRLELAHAERRSYLELVLAAK